MTGTMASKKHKTRQTKRSAIAARAAAQDTHGKKVKAAPAGRSIVDRCSCRNEFQDREHGPGRRVFNLSPAGTGSRTVTCTSCSARRSLSLPAHGKGDAQ